MVVSLFLFMVSGKFPTVEFYGKTRFGQLYRGRNTKNEYIVFYPKVAVRKINNYRRKKVRIIYFHEDTFNSTPLFIPVKTIPVTEILVAGIFFQVIDNRVDF